MAAAMMSSTMAKPGLRGASVRAPALPFRPATRAPLRLAPRVQAVQGSNQLQEKVMQAVTAGTLLTSFLSAGNAAAVSEVAQLAGNDGRLGAIALLFAPVLGWVAFNIGGPALNQLNETAARTKLAKRSVAVGLGLTAASLFAAQSADAATEVAQVAGDGRFSAIALLFAPVIGWVLYNIGGPALTQLNETAARNKLAKRSVVAGLGLTAASLFAAQSADAATEVAQVAGDGRFGAIALLFAPVVGWVLFNIGGPALNQLNETAARNKLAKRSVAAGLGLTAASLFAAQSADAATEVAQMAGDGRFGAIALLFAPVIGWVLFNIGGPALNQLNETAAKNKQAGKKRSIAGLGLGLTAASLAAAQSADAATEVAQVAGDGRFGAIALLFAPVIGWVLFNIGGPALNQLNETAAKNKQAGKKRSIAGLGLGLTAASLAAAQSADAATEVAQMAGDGRFGAIALLFAPVVGWVLFNIGGPALNQLNETAAKNKKAKGGRR